MNCYPSNGGVLAKANFHFAQEATLIYILEFSLNETYAQSKLLTNLLQYASRVWGGATQSIRVKVVSHREREYFIVYFIIIIV